MKAENPSGWSDLGIRTLSALALVPAVIGCIWLGGIWFQIFVLALTLLMAFEWVTIVHPGSLPQYVLHAAGALAGTAFSTLFGPEVAALAVLGLALAAGTMVYFGNSKPSVWSYLGVGYVGFPAIALVFLRSDPDYGFLAVLWICLIVWSADICAYFAGRMIGGPKLAPAISPKKTWAGLGGAVAGSALASIIVASVTHLNGILALAILAAGLAFVEQAGDLFESAMKRFHRIKDSGRLIPGHGGVIDRIDGLVAVAVAAAFIGYFHDSGAEAARGLLHW